jgi:hypothetical protein
MQILNQVAAKSHLVKHEFSQRIHIDAECQTDQDSASYTNLLNMAILKPNVSGNVVNSNGSPINDEIYITTYQCYQRVGKGLELRIKIDEGQRSGTTIVTFEEIRSKDRCQICMLNSHIRDRYVIHSECIKFTIGEEESHLMLLTFEKF